MSEQEPISFHYITLESPITNLEGFTSQIDLAFPEPQDSTEGVTFAVEMHYPGDYTLEGFDNVLIVELVCNYLMLNGKEIQWYFFQNKLADLIVYPIGHVSYAMIKGELQEGGKPLLLPGQLIHLLIRKVLPETE